MRHNKYNSVPTSPLPINSPLENPHELQNIGGRAGNIILLARRHGIVVNRGVEWLLGIIRQHDDIRLLYACPVDRMVCFFLEFQRGSF